MSENHLTVSHLSREDLARIFSKIQVSTTNFYAGAPCWEWTAGLVHGYGQFYRHRVNYRAHRFIYAWLVLPVPKGSDSGTLDHLCCNRRCVNPVHLDFVPSSVNVLRGTGPTAENARKTHCNQGHELIQMGQTRGCPECRKQYLKAYRVTNRERRKQYLREWRHQNPERAKQHNRDWRTRNPERRKQYDRERRKRNKLAQDDY